MQNALLANGYFINNIGSTSYLGTFISVMKMFVGREECKDYFKEICGDEVTENVFNWSTLYSHGSTKPLIENKMILLYYMHKLFYIVTFQACSLFPKK